MIEIDITHNLEMNFIKHFTGYMYIYNFIILFKRLAIAVTLTISLLFL